MKKKGKNEKNKKKIVYDFIIAPNGWCGFVKNTYLPKTVRDF